MYQSAEEILNGPDYFRCDKYRIRMKKAECIRRQSAPESFSFEIDYSCMICKDCEQGKVVKAEVGGQISGVRKRKRTLPRMDIIKRVEERRAAAAVEEKEKLDSRLRGNDEQQNREDSMTEKKVCNNCGEEKNINDFDKNKTCRGGRQGQCKTCIRDKVRARTAKKKKEYTGPTTGVQHKKLTPADVKKIAGPEKSANGAIETDDLIPTTAFDIMQLELENKEKTKQMGKLIVECVKKELLGAVFDELRGK